MRTIKPTQTRSELARQPRQMDSYLRLQPRGSRWTWQHWQRKRCSSETVNARQPGDCRSKKRERRSGSCNERQPGDRRVRCSSETVRPLQCETARRLQEQEREKYPAIQSSNYIRYTARQPQEHRREDGAVARHGPPVPAWSRPQPKARR